MTDAEYLRWLADDLGVAGQQHAATCARLREIALRLECHHTYVAEAGAPIGDGVCFKCGAMEPEERDDG